MSDDFFKTRMGQQFFEGTMRQIAQALVGIDEKMERLLGVFDKTSKDNDDWLAGRVSIDVDTHRVLLDSVQRLSAHFDKWFITQSVPMMHVAGEPKLFNEDGNLVVGDLKNHLRKHESEPPEADDDLDFTECMSCYSKPGSPKLCAACVHNREVIAKLKRRHAMRIRALQLKIEGLEKNQRTPAQELVHEISDALTAAVDEKDARRMGEELQQLFWDEGVTTQHDSDTLGAAANILRRYGYGPEKREES